MKETEVKIYTPDHSVIRQKLESRGARLVQPRVYEKNVRYDREDKSLSNNNIVLRLRQDRGTRLTYKEPGQIERGILTREEVEVEVSDFEAMDTILLKLGFIPAMIYEKYRRTYLLDDTQIMLDELPYGNFTEIEGEVDTIERVLKLLGLQNVERRSDNYVKLFEFVKHHLDLDFPDLTFENFEAIDVPESAFIPPGSIVIR